MKGIDTKSDKELLRLIKNNNQQALEELFERYYYRLCNFSFQYVRSKDLAEEVVSDVFLKIWKRRQELTITGNFKSYIYTATRNQSLNYVNKENNQLESIDNNDNNIGIVSERYQPDDELIFKELEIHLKKLIHKLSPRRKLIFKMSRYEGFTHREIAGILSISIQTVKNQMVSALKELRRGLR